MFGPPNRTVRDVSPPAMLKNELVSMLTTSRPVRRFIADVDIAFMWLIQ